MADQPTLTMRQRTALSIPPLLLRLALAVTFIWAGYAKTFGSFPVTDDNRGVLIAAGVLPESSLDGSIRDEGDAEPDALGDQPGPIEPVVDPSELPVDDPEPGTDPQETPEPEQPATSPVEPGTGMGDTPSDDPTLASRDASITLVAQAAQPDKVRTLNGLAIVVYGAANPQPIVIQEGEAGQEVAEPTTPMALMPATFGAPPWPVRLAWAAALTELIAGVLLLIGLATRFSGLAVTGVMGMAMWLTQIGPALQSGNTWLGFLPMYDPWDVSTYATFLWQLALLAIGLALVFSGPGMLSLDRWIFGRSGTDDED